MAACERAGSPLRRKAEVRAAMRGLAADRRVGSQLDARVGSSTTFVSSPESSNAACSACTAGST